MKLRTLFFVNFIFSISLFSSDKIEYWADLKHGDIGVMDLNKSDEVSDNIFHVVIDESLSITDKVFLVYELNGVTKSSGISKSINRFQSVGGYLTRTNNQWSNQREEFNPNRFFKGKNIIRFTIPSKAKYGFSIRNLRIEVEKGGQNSSLMKEVIVNNSDLSFLGGQRYLRGIVKGEDSKNAIIYIDGKEVFNENGEFDYLTNSSLEYSEIRIVFPDGKEITERVKYPYEDKLSFSIPFSNKGTTAYKYIESTIGGTVKIAGAAVYIPKGALSKNENISITALRNIDIPTNIVNVTSAAAGYRLLPDGVSFTIPVQLNIKCDPLKIPLGYSSKDIQTFFFDEKRKKWTIVHKESFIDSLNEVCSTTLHFTDFISGIIKVPESPQSTSFKSNSIKDLKAALPSDQIPLISKPEANNYGTNNVQIPIKLPQGRNGLEPEVALKYNSNGGYSWLGLGWNFTIPSISIETRWGVPRYDQVFETETYLLNGEMLTPVSHRDTTLVRRISGPKVFYPRKESDFKKIIRYGDTPGTYRWEVTSKNGSTYYYGGRDNVSPNAVLRDNSANENIGQWNLEEVVDVHGNNIRYYCSIDLITTNQVVNNGIDGKEIYLDSIAYTGFGSEPGLYKIKFSKRRNVSHVPISCRLGLKRVSSQLLNDIEITFRNQLVRRYFLEYERGEFGKQLLSRVNEFDSENQFFYAYDLSYFNEISSGDYLTTNVDWTVENDGIEASMANPIGRYNGEASIISGSASTNFSYGAAITIGGLGSLYSKNKTAGGNFSNGKSKGYGLTTLIDINGDGLSDKVFSVFNSNTGSELFYRENLSSTSGMNSLGFGGRKKIVGINQFQSSKTKIKTRGLEANFNPLFGSRTTTKTETEISTYFTDFNGDGLVDIARNGTVFFNFIDNDTLPHFTPLSDSTANPITPNASIDSDILPYDANYIDTLIEENPLHDVVRMWRVPFDGRVRIDAPIKLIEDTSQDAMGYDSKDGISYTIQYEDSEERRGEILLPGNVFGNTYNQAPLFLRVEEGEHIYFRLQSINDGAYDQVFWSPEIIYVDSQDNPTSELDVNGLDIYQYSSSEDFLLTHRQLLNVPLTGELSLQSFFEKPILSDDIEVVVLKIDDSGNEDVIFQQSYLHNETYNENINVNFNVVSGEQLSFKICSASNINWKEINWSPNIKYISTDPPRDLNDQDGNPLFSVNPIVEYTLYSDKRVHNKPFRLSADADIDILASLSINPPQINFDFPEGEEMFSVTVKTLNRLVKRKTYSFYNRRPIPFNLESETGDGKVYINEDIFFELHIGNDTLADILGGDIRLKINGDVEYPGYSIYSTISEEDIAFGHLYRGWGQFCYRSNDTTIASSEIDESLLEFDPDNYNVPSNNMDLSNDPTSEDFVIMSINPDKGVWQGYDEFTYLGADTMSSSRMGEDNVDFFNSNSNNPGIFESPIKITTSKSTNYTGSIQGPFIGTTVSFSNSKSTNHSEVTDLNGDRYPDIIGTDAFQYTLATGGLENNLLFNDHGVHSSSSNSKGASIGGGVPMGSNKNTAVPFGLQNVSIGEQNAKNSNSIPEEAKLSLGISGGFSSTQDETEQSWIDINGDGLPDKVEDNGEVSLNIGYSFLPPVRWGNSEIRFGESDSESAGLGFSYSNFSIAFGTGLNRTDNHSNFTLQDVNGDGLSDMVYLNYQADSLNRVPDSTFVRLNNGNRFQDTVYLWNTNFLIDEGSSTGESINASFTFCIPIFFIRICINPQISGGNGASRQHSQIIDINGDGFQDFIKSDNDGDLRVQHSTIGKTNLLRSINQPLGAELTFDYSLVGNTYELPTAKWVLTSVETFDGFVGDGADIMRDSFEYFNGYQDRREREFYGFEEVRSHELESSGEIYRTNVRFFNNSNFFKKGLLLNEVVQDGNGRPFRETKYQYDIFDRNGNNIVGTFFDIETESGFSGLVEKMS